MFEGKSAKVAIVGTGPAGLMAAWALAKAGAGVAVFEKKAGPARKLLLAGSSGLNITHDLPLEEFRQVYRGNSSHFSKLFHLYPPKAWLDFIHSLGIRTFLGAGGRYLVEGLKASPFVRVWVRALGKLGVEFFYKHECVDFEIAEETRRSIKLVFSNGYSANFDAVCFAFGGGSYEKEEVRWPLLFEKKGLKFNQFRASNVGFEVEWPKKLLDEAEGLPLKNITLVSQLGSKSGDLVITKYGLEGTPIYQFGEVGTVFLDLKPDVTLDGLKRLVQSSKENFSPIRKVQKKLHLSPGALALIFHCSPVEVLKDNGNIDALLERVKRFPIVLKARRPLSEAISSAGGLSFEELDESLMLRRFAGVFAAGEMLDWDAPTGGFLIQACASQGFLAGQGMIEYLKQLEPSC